MDFEVRQGFNDYFISKSFIVEACKPQGNEICAVAKCTAPRPGCNYDKNTYMNSEGQCCPAVCKEVCEEGK